MHGTTRRAAPRLATWLPGLLGLLLFGLVLRAYTPFLDTGFGATDSLPLVETSRFTTPGEALQLFRGPVMAGTRFAQGEVVYRPFVSLTFGLDHLVWGMNPLGYHVTNLAIHLCGVLAVWCLARELGLRWWSSLVAASVFALHPLVVASVPVIARRDSLMPVAAFTGGAACLLAGDRLRGGRALALKMGAAVLLAVALLSKESAFAAFAMLPMLMVVARVGRGDTFRDSAVSAIRLLAPYVVLAGVVFVLRFLVLRGLGGGADNSDLLVISLDKYGQIVGAFTRDLLWPFAGYASSTRELWQRLAAALLIGLAIGMTCLPRRPALVAAAGTLWIVGFGLFCVVLKIGTIAWLAYFSLVGVGLLFGGVLEGALARLRQPLGRINLRDLFVRAVSVGLLCALVVYGSSLLAASSLVRTYDQWRIAGEVTQRYSDALTACLAAAPTAGQVNLTALPSSLDDGRVETSLLGVTLLEDWTIDSVLRLVVPERNLGLHVSSWGTVRADADTLSFQCTPGRDAIELTTIYQPA